MNPRWLRDALLDWSLIGTALLVCHLTWWALPLTLLVVGNRQHALAVLGHDGAHFLVWPRRRALNDLLTNLLVFWPLLAGVGGYRKFHMGHHRHLGTPQDPERLHAFHGRKVPTRRSRIALRFLGDLLGFSVPEVVRAARVLKGSRTGPLLWWTVAVLSLWAVGAPEAVPLLLASNLTSFWAFSHLRSWTEHAGLGEGGTHRVRASWWARALFLPHNTWLHAEHHAHPQVPYHRLPSLREEEGLTVPALFRRFEA